MNPSIHSILRHYLVNKSSIISLEELQQTLPNFVLSKIENLVKDKQKVDKYKLLDITSNNLPSLVIVIPSWNNAKWVKHNLESILKQKYNNYRIIYIDDCSTDNTVNLVNFYVKKYNMQHRFKLVQQPSRNRQGCARFVAYHLCDDDEVICMLDGDDWLYDENSLLYIANEYKKGSMITYGCYKRYNNKNLETFVYCKNDYFPLEIIKNRNFRRYRWITQHIRTAYAGLFKRIRYLDLVDKNNRFFTVCTDLCEMFPVLEMASNRISLINNTTYVYNKDASNQHNTSYFRQNEFPQKKLERNNIESCIKNKSKYDLVPYNTLMMNRNLESSYSYDVNSNTDYIIYTDDKLSRDIIKHLVRFIDICQLPLLTFNVDLINKNNIFVKGCYTGKLTTDIKQLTTYIIGNGLHLNDLINETIININLNEIDLGEIVNLYN